MKLERLHTLLHKYPVNEVKNIGDCEKYHYVYLIVFESGCYYIGKHSTRNLNDGYFASGILPNRLKAQGELYSRSILSYEKNSTDALFLESTILSNGVIYSNHNCLNCYPGSPPSAEGSTVIHKNNKFKMINPKLLEHYLENGWILGAPKRVRVTNATEDRYVLEDELDEFLRIGYVLGRVALRGRTFIEREGVLKFIANADLQSYRLGGWVLKHPHEGMKVLRKGSKIIKTDSSRVNEYISEGYEPTSTVDGLIYIRRNGKFKRVSPCELHDYLSSGWETGTNIEGTVYVNNGLREFRIIPAKLHEYEANGHVKGRLNWTWLNNKISEVRINPNNIEEIAKYSSLGYVLGKKPRTCKRKVTKNGEVRYIIEKKIEGYVARGWMVIH